MKMVLRYCAVMGLLLAPLGFLSGSSQANAQTKEVAFTIDDLPVVTYGIDDTTYQRNLTTRLVTALQRNGIPAIGFVNERKLHNNGQIDKFRVSFLDQWLDHGLDLGNHSYSHPDYNDLSCSAYTADIVRGEPVLKELLGRRGKVLRYFRHPYLHVGNTKAKADSLSKFLAGRNYIVAPVSIDNDDYLFAVVYKRASVKKDSALMLQVGNDYISYLEQKLKYYEKQAAALFGRNIKQTLLFHASELNSRYIDSLIAMFKRNGYSFISLGQALQDPAYQTKVTKYGKWGISWLDRWALSAGKGGEFFADEPLTPAYIEAMAK
jgi:peptidoglycan/xylan/chitin deacetylase (PgdA/CDA1 family)